MNALNRVGSVPVVSARVEFETSHEIVPGPAGLTLTEVAKDLRSSKRTSATSSEDEFADWHRSQCFASVAESSCAAQPSKTGKTSANGAFEMLSSGHRYPLNAVGA